MIGNKLSWIESSPELLRKLPTPVPEHEWSLSLSDVWVCFWFDFAPPPEIWCLHIWTKWKQWTTKCTQQVSTVPPLNYIYYCFSSSLTPLPPVCRAIFFFCAALKIHFFWRNLKIFFVSRIKYLLFFNSKYYRFPVMGLFSKSLVLLSNVCSLYDVYFI